MIFVSFKSFPVVRLWNLYGRNPLVPSPGGCHFRLPLASPSFCLACHLWMHFEDENPCGSGFGFQGQDDGCVPVICPSLCEISHSSSSSSGFCFRTTRTLQLLVHLPFKDCPFPETCAVTSGTSANNLIMGPESPEGGCSEPLIRHIVDATNSLPRFFQSLFSDPHSHPQRKF